MKSTIIREQILYGKEVKNSEKEEGTLYALPDVILELAANWLAHEGGNQCVFYSKYFDTCLIRLLEVVRENDINVDEILREYKISKEEFLEKLKLCGDHSQCMYEEEE